MYLSHVRIRRTNVFFNDIAITWTHPSTRSSQNHRFRPRDAWCQLNRLPGVETSKSHPRHSPVSVLSVYIAEMNAMTTIRFRNIAYSASPFSHPRPFVSYRTQPTTPFLLYDVLSLRDESVRGNGRFSCCNRMARGIALGITFFYSENGDYCSSVWCLIAHGSDHLDTFRRLDCNYVFVRRNVAS